MCTGFRGHIDGAVLFDLCYQAQKHRNVYKLNIKYLSDNGISLFSFDDENEFIEEMNNA